MICRGSTQKIGRLGALNCWEHLEPLICYAMSRWTYRSMSPLGCSSASTARGRSQRRALHGRIVRRAGGRSSCGAGGDHQQEWGYCWADTSDGRPHRGGGVEPQSLGPMGKPSPACWDEETIPLRRYRPLRTSPGPRTSPIPTGTTATGISPRRGNRTPQLCVQDAEPEAGDLSGRDDAERRANRGAPKRRAEQQARSCPARGPRRPESPLVCAGGLLSCTVSRRATQI